MNTFVSAASEARPRFVLEIGLLVLLSLIWGSSFTLIKVAIDSVPPLTMVAVRVTLAAALLILVARAQGYRFPSEAAVWGGLFVQGFLQCALPFTLISWGEKYIASGLAGVLNSTPPVFVLIIAMATVSGRRSLDGRKIFGVVLGLVGVMMTIGVETLAGIGPAASLAQAAVLGASLCYALATMWGQRFSRFPAIVTAAGAMSTAAALMMPAALIVERPWTVAPTSQAVLAILVLSVACTALAMVIYFRLIRTLGALGTTSGSYLRAGFAVVLGIITLGESFSPSTMAGMLLIVLGVIAVTIPRHWPRRRG